MTQVSRFTDCWTGLLGLLLPVALAGAAQPARAQPPEVVVTPASGTPLRGQLVGLDKAEVRLSADGTERTIELQTVRQIAIKAQPAVPGGTLVGLTDGSRLAVNDITMTAETATAQLPTGLLLLPPSCLHWVAWPLAAEPAADGPQAPAWLADLPVEPAGDIVVIRRDDGWQFIACAIISVTADEVVVLLEEERIPVNRTKLAGLCWLRETGTPAAEPEPAAGEILLALAGGSLRCRGVSWSAADGSWQVRLATQAEGETVLPVGSLGGIDYAFGRRIDLTRRKPAEMKVEPYFGSLVEDDQLRSFFAARVIPVAAADETAARGLLLRPRTEMIWTIPPDSRRFRGTLQPASQTAITPTVVVIEVDGEGRFRAEIGGPEEAAAAQPIDIDLTGGRQLRLLVDFVRRPLDTTPEAASAPLLGGPILLTEPLIER